jgi:SAM-dependent methyltransferase
VRNEIWYSFLMGTEKFEGRGDGREIRKKPTPEASSFNWEDVSKNLTDTWFRKLTRTLSENGRPLDARTKVLEIGSGDGLFLKKLRENQIDAVGIDARPRAVGYVDGQVRGRIERLPFADNTFDVVVSTGQVFDSFVYRHNPRMMANEVARVLKRGGIYLGFVEPDFPPPDTLMRLESENGVYDPVYKKP